MVSTGDMSSIYQRPAELLQRLIRFDTTNPPGNEAECIAYINELLTGAGIKTTILAKAPERPNLIARLSGQGSAPPLLLYGHVDVVTTENQKWQHPPFEGKAADGFIWGRGALDMKGGVAMMLAAFLRP
jgi:acetylornithine deacetylase/succinyl-diaminopimelate desuccinylase-like protein